MAGLSSTLEIARNILLSEQLLIQTASHNIANADNKAYARQTVNVVTNPAQRFHAGWIGTGARIDNITQARDQYVEQQLMASTARESDYRTRSSFLETIGTYLKDDGITGLSSDLGRFWDAWDALSQNPGGIVERQGVVSTAESLAGTLQSTNANLTALKEKIQSRTGDTVIKINNLLSEIADYNRNIKSLENGGNSANDLRDLRYQALSNLSQLVGISYTEEANGSFTITLKDGTTPITLVSDQNSGSLSFDLGTGLVSYTDADGNAIGPNPNSLSGGTLAGLLASSQKTTDFSNRLNTLAGELIQQVNDKYDPAHVQKVFEGSSSADIAVNSTFANPTNVDASHALDIADLQNTKLTNLENSRFSDYIGAIQQQVGLDQQDASSRADFQQALVLQLQAQQQSVSGVSIDEETIELLKYQQIYQAAAKIVNITQTLLNAVIEMV
jgi:flagellar hook-associated protein 1